MEVPLLSQDEFFRHLELQSVHCVKFTYRQALKERLRATTKLDSLSVPRASGGKRILYNNNYKPNEGEKISSKSCRRIFGRSKSKKNEEESRQDSDVLPEDRKRTLEPFLTAMGERILPGMKRELNRYGSNDSTISSSSSSSSSSSQERVFIRRDYLTHRTSTTATQSDVNRSYNGNLRKRKRNYRCHVRIQDTSVPDKTNHREKTLIKPGDFPLAPNSKPSHVRPQETRSLVPHSLVTIKIHPQVLQQQLPAAQQQQLQRELTIPLIPVVVPTTYNCRSCGKPFMSRSGLAYHEEHAHSVCKFCSLWKKSKSTVCDRCKEMFSNQTLTNVEQKNKIMSLSNVLNRSTNQTSLNSVSSLQFFKCDFCPRKFGRKLQMIKHVMFQHSSLMHKVDLGKFVHKKTSNNLENSVTSCLLRSSVEA